MKWEGSKLVCDFCIRQRSDLSQPLATKFFVDGKTQMGPWAIMCDAHFERYGVGLGTGLGQKYDAKTYEKIEG